MSITTYGLKNLKMSFLKQLGKKMFLTGRNLSFEGRVMQKLMRLNESDLHDSLLRIKDNNKKQSILRLCIIGETR